MTKLYLGEGEEEPGCYVYAIFCEDESELGYVKFGRSINIDRRIKEVLTGCPIPVKYYAVVECYNSAEMKRTETALHKHFKDRNSSGEWFRFNFRSKEDKQAFNKGCKKVFSENMRGGAIAYWAKVNVKKYKKALEERAIERYKNWLKYAVEDVVAYSEMQDLSNSQVLEKALEFHWRLR